MNEVRHPTAQALIDTTVGLIRTNGPQSVTIDQVLATSGVSRGSLYHHFGDFPSLVDHALVWIYADQAMRDAAAVRRILEVSDSAAGLRSAIREVTESLHSPAAAEIRSLRTWTIAQSMVRPTLKEMLAQPQDEILDAMIGIIVTAQERGWVRPELDPRSTAIFIFSYSYGSSLGDLASVPMDRAAYVDLIMDVLDRSVFADHALD